MKFNVCPHNCPRFSWKGECEHTPGKIDKKRTLTQNNALHLYFSKVAEALNDSGMERAEAVEMLPIDIPWTTRSVKEMLWRPIQTALLGKESTTDLKKIGDIEKVWDVLNRALGEKGIESVAFPSFEEAMEKLEEEIHYEKN